MVSPTSQRQAAHNLPVRELLEGFGLAWQGAAPPPEIADFLSAAENPNLSPDPSARRQFLEELIKVDLEWRWNPEQATRASKDPVGARPQLERYAGLHTALGAPERLSL